MRLSAKEIARASNGITIVVRAQKAEGMIKVMAVKIDGTPLQGKAYEAMVESKNEVGLAAKEILRWVDKLGFNCPMASASRSRR